MQRSRVVVIGALVFIVAALGLGAAARLGDGEEPQPPEPAASGASESPDGGYNGLVRRSCALSPKILTRIWRGFDEVHSPDITFVPKEPNFWGSFARVSHTGPWDYLQEVPLVFYGPGRVAASGPIQDPVNITDVYATLDEMLGVGLPDRPSNVLDEAVAQGKEGAPKLVLVLIWDGVGRNVLNRWPDRWPNLAELERTGTSYVNATVGSSPSVTPATHSNLGTGAFPRDHKMVTIEYRGTDGKMHSAFERTDPRQLALTTFGDEIDRFFDNESEVGMLGWTVGGMPPEGPGAWITNHLGMLGHGTTIPGGDRDELALIGDTGNITANPEFWTLPPYLEDFEGLEAHADELDRADGQADGLWLGHPVLETYDNPAWVAYQQDILTTMIRESGYGADDVPDVLLTNFKMTDIAAHNFTIDSPELAESLEAQDAALADLISVLDEEVGDYVLVLSADHGHTPDPLKSGAWPIQGQELVEDVNERFDPGGDSLVEATEPVGVYIKREVVEASGIDPREVAKFLDGYTIRDNWAEDELPDGYEDRGSERVFSASFAKSQLPDIMRCKFGSPAPPGDLKA